MILISHIMMFLHHIHDFVQGCAISIAWGQQVITWNNVALSSLGSCCNHLWAISQEMLKISVSDMSLNIPNLRLQPHLPRLNLSPPSTTYMRQWIGSALVQIMACCLFDSKSLSEPMLGYCELDTQEQTSVKFQSKYKTFHSQKCI